MTATDYKSILSDSWDNIAEVAPVLPIGSWLLKCRNASVMPPKGEDGNESVLFFYSATEPMEDVEQEAIDALGKDYNYSDNEVTHRIWIQNGADKQKLRDHLVKHGINLEGMSVADSLKAIKGTSIVAYLTQEQYTTKSGETKIKNTPQNFVVAE